MPTYHVWHTYYIMRLGKGVVSGWEGEGDHGNGNKLVNAWA